MTLCSIFVICYSGIAAICAMYTAYNLLLTLRVHWCEGGARAFGCLVVACLAMPANLAREHDYNLPPSGSSARTQVLQQLFMPMQQRARVCEEEMRKCEADALSRGITFELVNHDWVLSELYSTLDGIAGDTTFDMIYCGTTSSPLWRWERGRNQLEGFKPHSDRYDVMYVLCVDWNEPVGALEELCIERLRNTMPMCRVANAERFNPGPIHKNDMSPLFLYVCARIDILAVVAPERKRLRIAI